MRIFWLCITFVSIFFIGVYGVGAGDSALPQSAEKLSEVSINITEPSTTDIYDASRTVGMQILRALKLLVSGFALIWLVIIGVNMIVFSENEDRIKSQKRQISYILIGFLFLNMPSLLYTIFLGDTLGKSTISNTIGTQTTIEFWDPTTFLSQNGFLYQLIGFFEVFIFGAAILTFTYGFFRLMISAGDEEVRKKSKNQVIYGILALLFLSFVRFWGAVIAKGDFFQEYATIGNKLFGLALYFAPPITIGFLVYAGFILITSSGDEERVKKAKSIFTNVLIASLILLGVYSFVTDLATFTL